MKFLANLVEISTTTIGQYPGDISGDSIIATLKGSASKGETAQVYAQAGFISRPAKSTKGIRLRIGSLDIIIGAFNYKVPLPTNPGDSKLYSTDSDGNEAATIKALADGILEINGNADFAVAFNDLKAGFDALKADLNTFITTKYNLHTHVSVTSLGTPTVPIPTGSSTAASIDASKIDSVKVP